MEGGLGDEQEWNTTSYTFDLEETFKKLHSKRWGLSGNSKKVITYKKTIHFLHQRNVLEKLKNLNYLQKEVSSIKLTTKHSKKDS